jgi:hypothetical protein
LAKINFNISINDFNESEQLMLTMLHYDVWQNEGGFNSLEKSIQQIGTNPIMVKEIIEVIENLLDDILFKEIEIDLPYKQPLKIHARYTRDQILAAFGIITFDKKQVVQGGTVCNEELNTELLFITLVKTEENYSPTTMFEDYAINETLFHWQSQNSISPNTPTGISYINHIANQKRILLFVRETKNDEFKNTMGYVFIGEGSLKDYSGAKPMNIKWELSEPLPHYLWNDAAKLRVG